MRPASDYKLAAKYFSSFLDNATNNVAELHGLHHATTIMLEVGNYIPDYVPFYVFIDNILTIRIGMGHVMCSFDPDMAKAIRTAIHSISQRHRVLLLWSPAHVGIPGNEVADFLANRGADGITSCDPPPSDFSYLQRALQG